MTVQTDGIHFTEGATGTPSRLRATSSQHSSHFFSLFFSLIFFIVFCIRGLVTKSRALFGIPRSESPRADVLPPTPPYLPPFFCVCVFVFSYALRPHCVCVCVSSSFFFLYLPVSAFCTHLLHAGCPFTPLPVFHTICESVSLGLSVCSC